MKRGLGRHMYRNSGSGGASLALNFTSPQLDPRITFSRTSQATVTGINGLIQYAPSNLLTYSQAFDNAAWTKSNSFVQTNLLLQSQTFTDATWSKATITVTGSAGIAPDSTNTATSVIETTAASLQHAFWQNTTLTAATYTLSMYAKNGPGSQRWLSIYPQGTGVAATAVFDLTLGTVTTTGGAQYLSSAVSAVGNGWYRCSLTFTAAAVAVQTTAYLSNSPFSGAPIYTGDGTSGIYVWGAQLVQGSVPGDYRATTSAALPVLYTAPDGTLTAEKLCEDATAAEHYAQQVFTAAKGSRVTLSGYFKAAERQYVTFYMICYDGAPSRVRFNLLDGSVSTYQSGGNLTTGIPVNVGNGWWRCSITMDAGTGAVSPLFVFETDSGSSFNYAGNGSSGIYVYGAQLEQVTSVQPTPQAYAATTSAAYYGPRFDYDPTNVVSQNLLTYSSDLTNVVWTSPGNTTISATTVSGPTGGSNANVINFVSGGAANPIRYYYTFAVGVTYTISMWVRSQSGDTTFSVDLQNAVTSSFPALTSSWQRVTYTVTPAAAYTWIDLQLSAAGVVEIYGPQLNVGSTALPYYATTSAPYTQVGIKGLLIEEGRTNNIAGSEAIGGVGWGVNAATVSTSGTAPNGTATAILFTGNGLSAAHYTNINGATNASGIVSSIYAKAGTNNLVQVFFNTDTAPWANFDLVNGTVGSTGTSTTASIQNVGNGWYRCVVATTSATATGIGVALIASSTDTRTPANTLATTVYLWGAQQEAGAFATSYIPTTSASVARAADNATLASLTGWYSQATGTWYTQWDQMSVLTGTTFRLVQADGTNTPGTFVFGASVNGGLNTAFSITPGSVTVNTVAKLAYSYQVSNHNASFNGGAVANSTNATAIALPTVYGLGSSPSGLQYLNGHLRQVTYYPRAFSNTELQSVTS